MEEEPHCRFCCARTLVVGKPATPPAARPARPRRKASRRERGGSCSRLRLLVIWLSFLPWPIVGYLPFLLLPRSEEHTSELQSLMRISYAVFCLKKKNN